MTRIGSSLLALFIISGCGTTYQLPEFSDQSLQFASEVIQEEEEIAARSDSQLLSPRIAVRNFNEVVRRVEPVAERFCERQTESRGDFNCDIEIRVITDVKQPANAFQTYDKDGNPIVLMNVAFISEARNQDEIAFALSHEMGHHIGTHIQKQQTQAAVGAILLGSLVAYGNAQSAAYDPYYNHALGQQNLENAMSLGAVAGQQAFSQSYELESDMLSTYITKAAGYDPVKGARIFARRESPKNQDGSLSFWGTHPPSEERIALVVMTMDKISSQSDQ